MLKISRYVWWACVSLVVALVITTRTLLSFTFPIPWNDETAFIAQAFALANHGTLFVAALNPNRDIMWMPPGYMAILAALYSIFGYSFELSRAWSSCCYTILSILLFLICRQRLTGWRLAFASIAGVVALASVPTLIVSNIARMEATYSLLFVLSMYCALRQRYVLGLAIVIATATIHFNAVYCLLPYSAIAVHFLISRKLPEVRSYEWLAMLIALCTFGAYSIYVLHHFRATVEDVRFQLSVNAHASGWWKIALGLAAFNIELYLSRRAITAPLILALFGTAFVFIPLMRFETWYYCAFGIGFLLCIVAALSDIESSTNQSNRKKIWSGMMLIAATTGLFHYSFRNYSGLTPLTPSMANLGQAFMPQKELSRISTYISALPAGTTVSFGYTGIEPFFFEAFERSGAEWSTPWDHMGLGAPRKPVDIRIICDSPLYPAFLSAYLPLEYQRARKKTACDIYPSSPK